MSALVLQPFIDKHAPDADVVPAPPDLIEAYRDLLPPSLLALWQHTGLGRYGGGLIQLVNPDVYRDVLCGWLLRDEDDGTRIPIALSAFGKVFYYRRLSDQGDEDISVLDPHLRRVDVVDWSLDGFFNGTLCDDAAVAELLDTALYAQAVKRHGRLTGDDIFYFVPALALGGSRDVNGVDTGDAEVHLSLLLQMALPG